MKRLITIANPWVLQPSVWLVSFSHEFVVVNDRAPVDVQYRVKEFKGRFLHQRCPRLFRVAA